MRSILLVLCLCASLLAGLQALAYRTYAETALSSPARPQYAEGDQAFAKRNVPEEAQKALELFRRYHSENPKDPEAGWRHSMGCYFAGLHLLKGKNDKAKTFAEGRDAGKAALKLAPDCAPCHFWTAINMALYGQTIGAVKMLFSLKSIRGHLQSTLKTEPAYAGAGAHRLLGLIEQKLPGVLGGSNARAKEHFERAIQVAPDEPMNHLFLVKLLFEKLKDKNAARVVAKQGLRVPAPSPERIESLGSMKELQEFLDAHPEPEAAESPAPAGSS